MKVDKYEKLLTAHGALPRVRQITLDGPSYVRVPWGTPFIKWAGGKRSLLPTLLQMVPNSFATYREPFLGGGALFFALQPPAAFINDINDDLITTCMVVRDQPDALIGGLARLEKEYRKRGAPFYYDVRKWQLSRLSQLRLAMRFIFLNKTCFNGLYRVNRAGFFNVPHGKFKSPPTICDAETIRAASRAMKRTKTRSVVFGNFDFAHVFKGSKEGDFIYADPPYAPLSDTSNFTAYAKTGFTQGDHTRLRNESLLAHERGAKVIISNSSADFIKGLYADKKVFEIVEVDVKRRINSDATKRGAVKELIIKTRGW